MRDAEIRELPGLIGEQVRVSGWLYNARSSGKLRFLVVRDGSGYLQSVVFKPGVPETVWAEAERVTQESSLRVVGKVKEEKRAPGGVELQVEALEIVQLCPEYPITPKEHGPDFLLNNRHLWLRSKRQHAVMRVRNELTFGIRDFFYRRNYVQIDSPILTPAAAEGTSTLFETDYFGEKAYLSQSGQLYLEPAVAAHGKVYCFGPTFRAEKSKTRRHLTEFWMVEPEIAWMRFDALLDLAEEFVSELVARVLERCKEDLERLERDVSRARAGDAAAVPAHRLRRRRRRSCKGKGFDVKFGDDFGGDEETALADESGQPIMITRYPAAIKAFYMEPDPNDPARALAVDMIAPRGVRRDHRRQRAHRLVRAARAADRRAQPAARGVRVVPRRAQATAASRTPASGWGSSGSSPGCAGSQHLREAIPYPRMINRLYP